MLNISQRNWCFTLLVVFFMAVNYLFILIVSLVQYYPVRSLPSSGWTVNGT